MEKSKFLTIIIVMLLVLNLGTLAFLFISRRPGPPPGMHERRPNPAEFITRELQFDETQKKQFEELKHEHQGQMRSLRDSIEIQRNLLSGVIVSGDDSQADSISSKIAYYQERVEWYTYLHFKKVRDLCKDDQKQKFKEIIGDVLMMMGPPKQGPPSPMH